MNMEQVMYQILEKLDNLTTEVTSIRKDLSSAKEDISMIKDKQLEHDSRFSELKETVKSIDEQSSTIALYARQNQEEIKRAYDKVGF